MTASRADVQAKLDAAVVDLGANPPNIPGALDQIGAARAEVGALLDPAPPPPPPPPPSSAWAWDATAATVAPNSASATAAFLKYGGPFAYFAAEVGVGEVTAHDASTYSVASADKQGGPFDPEIWFPNGVKPGVATDGHLTINDTVTGRWHDFEMYRDQGFVNGKVVGWTGGDSMPAGAVTEPPGGGAHGGATVARFPLQRGLVTLDDVKAGAIEHALVYTMTNCGPGLPPYPSGSRSRYTAPNVSMPASLYPLMPVPGTWLALDPAVSLAAVHGFEWMVAEALQRFGMFCRDRSTDCALHGADLGGGGASFPAWRGLGVPVNDKGSLRFSAAFVGLLQHLRVLAPPKP